eukprot:TRINITY_DN434_c0_g1::TRINITY_DN434_c0_g1_i1::g.2507::m.2507 TRINITY_DN434_c0_g1::TRINITY_DN434_c0_g1_i1::g.2507  ORF type:complete len:348 (-),score=97.74,sp/Q9C5Z2/EIF3H_ARATH/47.60/2e-96,JAB/PF01398.16/1.5e-14,Phage_HK97_TLTM/PF06120.6/0.036 TRINITY_DN434_c0_g1_i1:550-1539(-)
MARGEPSVTPSEIINEVELHGLVLLKIIKHCKESLPNLVTGQLLGLDVDETLEVTNCFPFPSIADENEESGDSVAEYQVLMMKCLNEIDVDNNTVGWYQSTYLGSFLSESWIDTQYNYQENLKHCISLIYDPLRTAQGQLSIRAYRLTETFMKLYRLCDFSYYRVLATGLTSNSIYEEVPIRISNPGLVGAMLLDLDKIPRAPASEEEKEDFSSTSFLEKNMEFLIDCIDDLAFDQRRFTQIQRQANKAQTTLQSMLQKRRIDNERKNIAGIPPVPEDDLLSNPMNKNLPELPRLEALLLTNQIGNYAKQINEAAGQSLVTHFLTNGVH